MLRRVDWGWIALGLYVLSLMLPCLTVRALLRSGYETHLGVECLMFGFGTVPWYANLLLLFIPLANRYHRYEISIGFGLGAIAAALTTPYYLERGEHVNVGYFVWLASMAAMLAASVASLARSRELKRPEPDVA